MLVRPTDASRRASGQDERVQALLGPQFRGSQFPADPRAELDARMGSKDEWDYFRNGKGKKDENRSVSSAAGNKRRAKRETRIRACFALTWITRADSTDVRTKVMKDTSGRVSEETVTLGIINSRAIARVKSNLPVNRAGASAVLPVRYF